MRILHILDHSIPLHSGYTFRTRSILREQRRRGWETEHLTSPKQGPTALPEETVDGLLFHRTAPATGWFAGLPVAGELALMKATEGRLEEVARRLRPDILHAHSPVLNALPAIAVGRRLGIPVVYEIRAFWEDAAVDHGSTTEGSLRYRATRALETHALRRVDAVTTICEGLRRDIVERGIPESKVTVIPNAVDIDEFAESSSPDPELKGQLGLEGSSVLGFIGSFYAYEGLPLLVEALPRVVQARPEARLLLVGGGPAEAALRQRVADLGLTERVVFTGRVPHNQVQRYYNLVDVFVYPRLSMRLTDLVTPLKPLEAMAQRRLVVASDVGGHRELIRDGETGVLFRAGDPVALADAVVGLLGQRERWPALHDAGRAFVERERSWEASVARYREVYGQALGPRRAEHAAALALPRGGAS